MLQFPVEDTYFFYLIISGWPILHFHPFNSRVMSWMNVQHVTWFICVLISLTWEYSIHLIIITSFTMIMLYVPCLPWSMFFLFDTSFDYYSYGEDVFINSSLFIAIRVVFRPTSLFGCGVTTLFSKLTCFFWFYLNGKSSCVSVFRISGIIKIKLTHSYFLYIRF